MQFSIPLPFITSHAALLVAVVIATAVMALFELAKSYRVELQEIARDSRAALLPLLAAAAAVAFDAHEVKLSALAAVAVLVGFFTPVLILFLIATAVIFFYPLTASLFLIPMVLGHSLREHRSNKSLFAMTGLLLFAGLAIATVQGESGMTVPPEANDLRATIVLWLLSVSGVALLVKPIARRMKVAYADWIATGAAIALTYLISFFLLAQRGWRFATIFSLGLIGVTLPRKWKIVSVFAFVILATWLADHDAFYTLIPLCNGGLYRVQTVFALGLLGFTATLAAAPWIFALVLVANVQGSVLGMPFAIGCVAGALAAFASSRVRPLLTAQTAQTPQVAQTKFAQFFTVRTFVFASLLFVSMALAILNLYVVIGWLIAFAIVGLFFERSYIEFTTVAAFIGASLAQGNFPKTQTAAVLILAALAAAVAAAAITRRSHSPDGLSDVKSKH